MDADVERGYGAGLDPSPELVGQPQLTKFARADRTITDHDVRCSGQVTLPNSDPVVTKVCNRKLAELVGRPWKLVCPRCKATNLSPT